MIIGGFVRRARKGDAEGVARVQIASWRAGFAGLVPEEVIDELADEELVSKFTERWLKAITSPPTSKHRVHVAIEKPKPEILGFASFGPATDEDLWPATDGELYELHVLPAVAGGEHDQRLLNAVADTLGEDGFRTGYTWALEGDSARIELLEGAGWAQDGSRTNLDMGTKVPVVRLHTQMSQKSG